MALILANRVQETATANTTVSFSLAGASTGYTTFSSTVGNTNTTYYGASDGTNWEVGIGTYATTGNLLTRTTILASSNANAAVTFSGTVTVFIDYPSSKSVYLDASGNASALGTPASGVVTNLTGTASININGTVGATTPTTGAFTTVSATGVITSTLATGTAPFTVASTTQVANLNAATAGTATSATTATNLASGALGSIPYQNAAGTTLFLAGNTTTTPQFVTSTGASSAATAPTLTGSTGSGNVVLATSPTLVTPALGTPASGTVTNLTGTASININGTVGATTPSTGAFTTLSATTAIPLTSGGTGSTTAAGANANLQAFTTTPTASGTTALSNTSTYYQYFTGSLAQTITLPLNTDIKNGWSFHVANNSTGNLTVNSNSGALVATVIPQTTQHITCVDATVNTAAAWDSGSTDFGSLTGTGAAVLAVSPTITGTPSIGTAGSTTTLVGNISAITSNQTIALSPTGTGTVAISPAGALTINPTAASTINNASIGATTASTGRFTTVTSTIATGTAPFTVASTTQVANLNAATAGTAAGLSATLVVGSGGTGITTTPTNGQIPIGNGTNYTAATLTQGTGISVTNASGAITIANTGTLAFSGAGAAPTTSLTSTGLTAALGVGTYKFVAHIYGQSSSAAGGTFQIAYSGTTTSIDIMQQGQATGTTWVATNRQTAVNTAGTVVWTTATTEMTMLITGVIVTGTAGTFTINATKTTSGTLTIRSGSNLLIG